MTPRLPDPHPSDHDGWIIGGRIVVAFALLTFVGLVLAVWGATS